MVVDGPNLGANENWLETVTATVSVETGERRVELENLLALGATGGNRSGSATDDLWSVAEDAGKEL